MEQDRRVRTGPPGRPAGEAAGGLVRLALLRSTQHLAVADDFRRLRPALQPVLDRTARSPYFAKVSAGLDGG
ncbi:DNA glycosylase AlkZ-like family protein [Planotetraspora sp. A-T 1434]|uniref:DNA glycosylase AlkZ-like family protein n=1 Tax=Planotetraspora sp. A-T 1434 TaxID=2979219 RepID=UPI003965C7A0